MVPVRLDLKKDEKLEIEWEDGRKSVYKIDYLRAMCPCATCKATREEGAGKKSLLTVLPGNYAGALSVSGAELVGNYAIKLSWSDGHDTGIYSFGYLRDIAVRGWDTRRLAGDGETERFGVSFCRR